MERPEVALIFAYDAGGRLLLGRRRDSGLYTLPGGHVEEDECPCCGAKRELYEETGLKAFSLSPAVGVRPHPPQLPELHVYTALVAGAAHGHLDPDRECADWAFYDVSDGLDPEIYDHLHGPAGDLNVVRQMVRRGSELPEESETSTEGEGSAEDRQVEKSEDLAKSDLLDHHDPRERELAVRTGDLTPRQLYQAALDDDHDVRMAALQHPAMDGHLLRLLCAARRLRGGAHPGRAVVDFLAHPQATAEHARIVLDAARAHGRGAEEAGQIAEERLGWPEMAKAEPDEHPLANVKTPQQWAAADPEHLRRYAHEEGLAFSGAVLPKDPSWSWSYEEFPAERLRGHFKHAGGPQGFLAAEQRSGSDRAYMDDLKHAWTTNPHAVGPVVLADHSQGLEIGDGWHRAALALAHGMKTIPAVVGRRGVAKAEPQDLELAEIHNDPQNPMTVYRVEGPQGQGPYQIHDSVPAEVTRAAWARFPGPQQPPAATDFTGQEFNPWTAAGAKGRFGFERPEHAEEWFGPEHMATMAKHGFRLVPVKAAQVFRSKSGKQVFYMPHSSAKGSE